MIFFRGLMLMVDICAIFPLSITGRFFSLLRLDERDHQFLKNGKKINSTGAKSDDLNLPKALFCLHNSNNRRPITFIYGEKTATNLSQPFSLHPRSFTPPPPHPSLGFRIYLFPCLVTPRHNPVCCFHDQRIKTNMNGKRTFQNVNRKKSFTSF